jgi:subtilisin family serine protease
VVDLLSPGEKIYSTLPNQIFGFQNGTSMSAPIVSHIAGLIRAYFPKLTAKEVKEILLQSCVTPKITNTPTPNFEKAVPKAISEICATGGIINAALSVQNASNYISKRKK